MQETIIKNDKIMKKIFLLSFILVVCSFARAQEKVNDYVKAGTIVPLVSLHEVRGKTAHIGEMVDFKVSRDVMNEDKLVIPSGAIAKGEVYKANRSSWWGTKGKLGIRLKYVTLPNGKMIYLTNSDIYITGKNRTPLSVVLSCCGLWEFMFLCGTKAVMPVGYEFDAHVANDTQITL